MPETRVPLCTMPESDNLSLVDDKTDSHSERSSSPKSDSSRSEISDTSALSLEFSDSVSDDGMPQTDLLSDEFEAMKMTEEDATKLAQEGADVRHVLKTSWKLQNKYGFKKQASRVKTAPGKALRDMASAQRLSIEEHMRSCRHAAKVRPPPGFLGQQTVQQDEPAPILVSYADGSNSLTMLEKPVCLHNITVSCVEDACHVFIQQMKNPTFRGLEPLEEAIAESFREEVPAVILRPIAIGSLLAVNTDDKWYRCQVVGYNVKDDSCEVKFVDHGGYTTVQVDQLRQLRSDFVRLPFQAIEVYIAHVKPAGDEAEIDIAADILFRDDVSIQHLGFAEDGIPVVQAYFYQEDYINLFTQEILEDCYKVLLEHHPDYIPTPTLAALTASDTDSVYSEIALTEGEDGCCSEDGQSTDEGVWSPECTEVPQEAADTVVYAPVVAPVEEVAWAPVEQPMVAYYIPDPNTGALYYVTAPLVPVAYPVVYVPEEVCAPQQAEIDDLESKPYEEWTQEDYERYYGNE